MAERDLTIKVTTDAAAAKAEVDGLASSVEKLNEAQAATATGIETGTSAENALATVSETLVSALQNAKMNMLALGEAVVVGGKGMSPALLEARDSVAALEVAIERAKAAGAPVSPAAQAALLLYDGQVKALTLSLEASAGPAGQAASNTRLFSIEAALARDNVAGLARGLATMGGAVAGVALPLLLIGPLLDGIKKGLEAVGVSSDDIKVAFGGVSQAAIDGAKGIEAFQAKLNDLAVSQRAYVSGVDLLSAANLDVKTSLEAMAAAFGVTTTSGRDFENVISDEGTNLVQAKEKLDRFVTGLDAIRVMSQSTATELQGQFIKALQDIKNGVPGATEALDKVIAKEKELEKSANDFSKQLENTYGKDGPAAFAKFTQAVDSISGHLATLRAAGLSENEIFAAMKGQLDVVTEGSNRFVKAIASASPELQAEIAVLLNLAKGHDATAEAVKKHEESIRTLGKEYDGIQAALAKYSGSQADLNVALVAERADIDSLIDKLEKKKAALGDLSGPETFWLTTLKDQQAALRAVTPEIDRHTKAVDDAKAKVIAFGQEELKVTKTLQDSLATIREHATAQIAAADSELKSVTASLDGQITALNKMHADGLISDSQYNQEVSKLLLEETEVRHATADKEKLINDERAQSEKAATDKFVEDTARIKAELEKRGSDLAKAEQAAKDFAKANEASTAALAAEAAALAAGSTTRKGYETEIKAIGTVLDGVAKNSVPGLTKSLDGLMEKLDGVTKKLGEVSSAATAAFASGGASTPVEPAPTTGTAAPGTEF